MINTLYLPELRELLAQNNTAELEEFCVALHPARTAEFMEGLSAEETWEVLRHANAANCVEVFIYIERDKQVLIVESQDQAEVAAMIAAMPPDDRVDLLKETDNRIVAELLPLIPAEERRDILRLRAYPEGSAGALMTTEFAKLSENLSVGDALGELAHQAEHLETIYYIYVVDDRQDDRLRGLVSARQLVSAMGKPDTRLCDLMERDLIVVNVLDDQEEMAGKVARYNLLAIPVVDEEHRMLGIITHDDVIDVMREEATEDAHRIAGVAPLVESYLDTHLLTLTWKRGIWVTVLFFAALITALVLHRYEQHRAWWPWLVVFIPLVISSGGNSGNQSATLVITGLAAGDINLRDWLHVIWRELLIGVLLGGFLSIIGFIAACILVSQSSLYTAIALAITLLLVVVCGTISGAVLPLLFKRLGLDPALMSNPFVAGIIDIVGIVIYMTVASMLLPAPTL